MCVLLITAAACALSILPILVLAPAVGATRAAARAAGAGASFLLGGRQIFENNNEHKAN